jgi:hypothetical protein
VTRATILTSPTGTSGWTVRTNPWDAVSTTAHAVAADGSGNLVAGAGVSAPTPVIEQSTDGTSWSAETSDLIVGFAVVYDPVLGLWLIGGQGVSSSPTPYTSGVVSSNRTSWTSSLNPSQNMGSPPPNVLAAVALSSGGFCVGTHGGTAWTTPDGSTWTENTTGFDFGAVTGMATDGTTILAVGYDSSSHGLLQVSTDGGSTWTTVSGTPFSGSGAIPNFAAYGNGTWIVGDADSGTIMTASSPAGPYTVQTTPFDSSEINSAAWSSDLSLWCAVGQGNDGGVVMTSPDTATWTERSTPIDSSHFYSTLYGVCWDHTLGMFVAVGNGQYTAPSGWAIGMVA